MTPLMQNRPSVFRINRSGFPEKKPTVSPVFEIFKDEISCLIRFSQDLRNWMHLDCYAVLWLVNRRYPIRDKFI